MTMPEGAKTLDDMLAWIDESIARDKKHWVRYRLRRGWHHLTHPTEVYRDKIYWPVRTFIERGRRGWSVRDAWSLDDHISRVMAGALEHMRKTACGYPGDLSPEAWDMILAEMARGFRRWVNHYDDPDEEEAYREVQASIELMRIWFGHLWD